MNSSCKKFQFPTFLLLLWAIAFSGLLFTGSGCKTTNVNRGGKNKIQVPADVAAAYREDAARLAVRDINTTNTSANELQGIIPPEMIENYYNNLCNIYKLSKTIDTIPDLGKIHTIKRPDLRHITVVLNDDASFRDNWQKGYTLSNNLYLNQIIGKYKLKILEYQDGSQGPTVKLESPDFINTTEVAYLLSQINGFKSGQEDGVAGDGDNIETGAEGKNAIAIRFSIGRGDCPSGCIQRKYWVFYINPDKSISFMGTRGSLSSE